MAQTRLPDLLGLIPFSFFSGTSIIDRQGFSLNKASTSSTTGLTIEHGTHQGESLEGLSILVSDVPEMCWKLGEGGGEVHAQYACINQKVVVQQQM